MGALSRSEIMRRIRGKDTSPEMAVRRLLHHLGHRYRLHCVDLPGTPDIVFRSRRKIVFVHGCFWHQHGCALCRRPKSNLAYWLPKLERNKLRDLASLRKLRADGWSVCVIWECQILAGRFEARLLRFLDASSASPSTRAGRR